jgi:hypothetical protein
MRGAVTARASAYGNGNSNNLPRAQGWLSPSVTLPPGTSKWNKIEHRLFSHIAMNWRGKPLVDLVTIVNLIGDTTSAAGLRVRSEIDRGQYPQGVVITDDQLARLHLEPHAFHGEWNYTLWPAARH